MKSTEVYALLRGAWAPALREEGFKPVKGLVTWAQDHGGHFLLINAQVSMHGWDSSNGSCLHINFDVTPTPEWRGAWWTGRFGESLAPEVVAEFVSRQQQIARRIDDRAERIARDNGERSLRVDMCEASGDDFRYAMALAYYDEDDLQQWLPLMSPLLLPEAYRYHDRHCDAGPSKQERRSARSPVEIKRFEDFWASCRSCERRVSPRPADL